jgi:glycerol-3-phosphate dehydrogenase
VHGGLRYLEMFDFGLVREALEERGLLLTRLAPHLVRPVPFLYPLHKTWERPYVGAGLVLYDGMAMAGKYDMGVPKHKHLFRRQVARMAPDLRTDQLTGAIRYYDCQVDDARLVMNIARTAAAYGAHVASRTKVVGFLRDGERVVGATIRDLENDVSYEVRAKVVINAAGVWTDEIQELAGGRGALHVEASKGIHLVVPRDRIRSETGFITKTEKSVRDSVGTALDHRHHRHRVEPRPGASGGIARRHRLRAGPRQHLAQGPPRPRRRRGRVRRLAAAAQG